MQLIARERIRENPWNPNAFDPDNYPKLLQSIRQHGIMEPLKVMLDPECTGHPLTGAGPCYLLVDGYHRWKAAADLAIAEVPCEVWDVSIEDAKLRGLQLNYLRGQAVPLRLAGLVHDLSATYSLDDLAGMLPWSEAELQDCLELMRLPADLEASLREAAAAEEATAPRPVTVVLVGSEHEIFERAMAAAKEHLGRNRRRGECLQDICRAYLDLRGDPGESASA